MAEYDFYRVWNVYYREDRPGHYSAHCCRAPGLRACMSFSSDREKLAILKARNWIRGLYRHGTKRVHLSIRTFPEEQRNNRRVRNLTQEVL